MTGVMVDPYIVVGFIFVMISLLLLVEMDIM